VGGTLSITGASATVGTAVAPIYSGLVVGGCKTTSNPTAHACTTADRYYVTNTDTYLTIDPPVADFPTWYLNADPGPKHICDTTLTPSPNLTASTNKFDNDTTRNGTNPAFNLTPTASDYNCVTSGGTLKWNHTTHLLTIAGTIFFDGNLTMQDNLARYHGIATIYANGTIYFNNGSGGAAAGIRAGCPPSPAAATSQCAFNTPNTWNPNSDLLVLVANKSTGTAIDMSSDGTQFQGSLFCPPTSTANLIGDSTSLEGGIICGRYSWNDHNHVYPLPLLTTNPTGAPLPPNVAAKINPPVRTSG
jgi:hypothetical protein